MQHLKGRKFDLTKAGQLTSQHQQAERLTDSVAFVTAPLIR